MDITFLPQLDPRSTYYFETFSIFKKNSNQNEKILEWLSDKFEEDIISKLVKKEKGDGHITIFGLGIGSGDGTLEVELLKPLRKKVRKIVWTNVEPSAEQITRYKKLVDEQKDTLDGLTFDWRQVTLQEFCKDNFDGSKKFHFVCAIHSLYYIPIKDFHYYMKTLLEWTDGKILMMHCKENGPVDRLKREFARTVNRETNVTESLEIFGIPFDTRYLSDECDITSCLKSDSQDGKLMLDFLLHRVGCRDDGPSELVKKMEDFLKREGILCTRNERFYIPLETQIVITSNFEECNI